jgi:hypothetical protein
MIIAKVRSPLQTYAVSSRLFVRNWNLCAGNIPGHDEEVGLIQGEEFGSLLLRPCTSSQSLCSAFLSLRGVLRLDGVRVDNCPN